MKKTIGKRLYSPMEAYPILWKALRCFPKHKKNMADGMLSLSEKGRIMLAVTQVNGCAMCSYAHTQMALESGMSSDEIEKLLAGDQSNAPKEELTALLFAQHYADTRGNPTRKAFAQLVCCYGQKKAEAILCAIRIIMLGNTYGIPFGSCKGRIKHDQTKIDPRSTLPYEVGMLITLLIFLPIALVHALLASFFPVSTFVS